MKQQPQSAKSQLALLAHIYKMEIIELCSMTALWLVGAIEELADLAWSIVVYKPRYHQRRHR